MRPQPIAGLVLFAAYLGLGAFPAQASDDPLVCGPRTQQWDGEARSAAPAEVEAFFGKIPTGCGELRAEVNQFRPTPEELPRDVTIFDAPDFRAEIEPCAYRRTGIECTLYVTPTRSVPWYFNDHSHLIDVSGGLIPVSSMTIGGQTRSVSNWGYRVEFMTLQPGVRTKLVYRFDKRLRPRDVQAAEIEAINGNSLTLTDMDWR